MRAIIDTNVLLSGYFWRGPPHLILVRVRDGEITPILSPALLAELSSVIGRPQFTSILQQIGRPPDQLLVELLQLGELIDPPPLAVPICRDPDDDKLLALARPPAPMF